MQIGMSAFTSAALTCCCANTWAELFVSQPPHFSPTIAHKTAPKATPQKPYVHFFSMIDLPWSLTEMFPGYWGTMSVSSQGSESTYVAQARISGGRARELATGDRDHELFERAAHANWATTASRILEA